MEIKAEAPSRSKEKEKICVTHPYGLLDERLQNPTKSFKILA